VHSRLVGAKTDWIGEVKPKLIVMDNGSEFTNEKVTDALKALRVDAVFPPAGQPKKRPFIESLFHTLGPLLHSFYSGQTFRSIDEKGDYDPALHASMFVDEFVALFILGVCDIYHNRPHGSLGGRTPHSEWCYMVEEFDVADVPPDDEEMLRAFGEPDTATLDKYGVRRMGVHYRNERLDNSFLDRDNQPVEIKVDKTRINDILVKDKKGWFLVENQTGIDSDMSEAEWVRAGKMRRTEAAEDTAGGMDALFDAVNKSRKAGESAVIRAGMSPMKQSQAERERDRKGVFHGYEPQHSTNTTRQLADELALPDDDLRSGELVTAISVSEVPAAPTSASTPHRKPSRYRRNL
jgi:putative transposase